MTDFINEWKIRSIDVMKNSSLYRSADSWHKDLAERDRKIVHVLAGLFVATLFYSWAWQPITTGAISSQKKLDSALEFHSSMKSNAYLFTGQSNSAAVGGSILSRVNGLAKAKGIQLKRFEPEGSNGLRVWLDKVSFNSLIDLIEILETEKGISIEQISIEKAGNGLANLRAVFKS